VEEGSGLDKVTYKELDFFGQVEVLQQRAPMATRKAGTPVVLGLLETKAFMNLLPLHKFIQDSGQQQFALHHQPQNGPTTKMRGRRYGESAEATTATTAGPSGSTSRLPSEIVGSAKSDEAVKRIMNAVKANIIFSRLNDKQLTMLQQAMSEHHVKANENVITQGEKGNHYYIVDSGELDAYVKGAASEAEKKNKELCSWRLVRGTCAYVQLPSYGHD